MAVNLKTCDQGTGQSDLKTSIEALLLHVDSTQSGLLPPMADDPQTDRRWEDFLDRHLLPVKEAVFTSYQATAAMRLEDVLQSSQDCLAQTDRDGDRLEEATTLALAILASTQGARHRRLLERLEEAWQAGAPAHPAVNTAVKAAMFHEPLPAAQGAYFFQEWRASQASQASRRPASGEPIECFLQTQPLELLTLAPMARPGATQPSSCSTHDGSFLLGRSHR